MNVNVIQFGPYQEKKQGKNCHSYVTIWSLGQTILFFFAKPYLKIMLNTYLLIRFSHHFNYCYISLLITKMTKKRLEHTSRKIKINNCNKIDAVELQKKGCWFINRRTAFVTK